MSRRPARLLAATAPLAAAVLAAAAPAAAGPLDVATREPQLAVFSLRDDRVSSPSDAPEGPLPIGSLAKPFVAHAWAIAHPGHEAPAVACTPASRCWNASGHGTLGLVRATAVSCNTYFRALAADTPAETLAATLRAAGFVLPDPLTPEGAIGLPTGGGLLSAEPGVLLRAYAALLREPWGSGEPLRRLLLAGLRDSAREGTASGLAGTGFHAKTGTVPAIDGRPLATSGWAIAVDESGRGFLALLTPGTGRQAARALARRLRTAGWGAPRQEPTASLAQRGSSRGLPASARPVRVSLFSALAPRLVVARNVGTAPTASSRGFVGVSGTLDLHAGDRLQPGDWELALPASGLRRVVRGGVRADAGPRGVLRIRAELAPIEYVGGVIAAEIPGPDAGLRVALGAAVLRFLSEGPRHGDVDVCDLTHCAFFVGRGPRVAWPVPGRAALLEPPAIARAGAAGEGGLDVVTWRRILAEARAPGPSRWTSHCGGEPLSAHAVWGGTDRTVYRCPRHGPGDRAEWVRLWRQGDLDRALGGRVDEVRVEDDDGLWTLFVRRDGLPLRLTWDEAHARLAGVLGWGALPSPADRVVHESRGFRAEGRGLGHRVGLCLGSRTAPALLD